MIDEPILPLFPSPPYFSVAKKSLLPDMVQLLHIASISHHIKLPLCIFLWLSSRSCPPETSSVIPLSFAV